MKYKMALVQYLFLEKCYWQLTRFNAINLKNRWKFDWFFIIERLYNCYSAIIRVKNFAIMPR